MEFKVIMIAKTPNPQQLVWCAMHQCYSPHPIGIEEAPIEEKCGEIVVRRLLKGDRGHYGPLEHPQITFACANFPHSVMQQARTHRVGVSFDCQSMRHTAEHILMVAKGDRLPEEVFYLRPVGEYSDRLGNRYEYTHDLREQHLSLIQDMCQTYADAVDMGMPYEQARGLIPFDVRQHFVVSFNLRSLMHFLDLRAKKDAQIEIQQLCELMMVKFEFWCPAIALWYKENRWGKARLAP